MFKDYPILQLLHDNAEYVIGTSVASIMSLHFISEQIMTLATSIITVATSVIVTHYLKRYLEKQNEKQDRENR